MSSIGHLGNRLPAYTYTQTQLRKVHEHLDNIHTTQYRIHKIRANGHLCNRLPAYIDNCSLGYTMGSTEVSWISALISQVYTVRTCYTPSDTCIPFQQMHPLNFCGRLGNIVIQYNTGKLIEHTIRWPSLASSKHHSSDQLLTINDTHK